MAFSSNPALRSKNSIKARSNEFHQGPGQLLCGAAITREPAVWSELELDDRD